MYQNGWLCGTRTQRKHEHRTPESKAQKSLWKRAWWKDFTARGTGDCSSRAVRLCLLEMSERLHPWRLINMAAWTRPEQWQHSGHVACKGERSGGPNSWPLRTTGIARVGKIPFLRGHPTIGNPIPSGQLWDHMHTSNTEHTEQVAFIYLGTDLCNN